MIQLAVSTYSLARWRRERGKSLVQSLQWLADNGVHGVEFSGIDEEDLSKAPRRAAALRRLCDKLNLQIHGYCIGAELLCAAQAQAEAVGQLKRHVEVAAALGVTHMRHDVTRGDFNAVKGHRGPKTFAAALKMVTPAIRIVADHAAQRGVRTSLENHGFYCQAPNRVEQIIKHVNHENFGLTLDMGNFLCVNADPVAAVRQLLPWALHVHVKDFHIRSKRDLPLTGWFATPTPIALRGAIVGHGHIDIPAQLALLRKARYDGWLSLEFEGLEDPELAIREGLAYLANRLGING
jgi:sugar phosphate isomerase/epimerase